MRNAWTICTQKKGEVLDFTLVQLILRLICLLPLLGLISPSSRFVALLSPILMLFVWCPARVNAAACMQESLAGGRLFSSEMVTGSDYRRKLLRSILTGVRLGLWLLPFLGVTLFLYRVVYGEAVVGQTDVFSVLMFLFRLGGGDIVRGSGIALALYLLLLLPFAFGLSLHAGDRHLTVCGKNRPRGYRKHVMGDFWKRMLGYIPFLIVCGIFGGEYVGKLLQAMNNLGSGGLHLPHMDAGLYWILGTFAVLVIPYLPLRSLYIAQACREKLEETHAA